MHIEREVVSKQHHTLCDVCSNEDSTCPFYRCVLCRQDLCLLCTTFDSRDTGDYPAAYCKACWNIGEPFRKKIEMVTNNAEQEIHRLEVEWQQAAARKTP